MTPLPVTAEVFQVPSLGYEVLEVTINSVTTSSLVGVVSEVLVPEAGTAEVRFLSGGGQDMLRPLSITRIAICEAT